MTMQTHTWCRRLGATLSGLVFVSLAAVAHGDATGSYDGNLTVSATGEVALVTGTLTQSGKTVTGTVTIELIDPMGAGTYTVSGKATPKKLKLQGVSTTGAQLKWKGKWTSTTAALGKAKVKAPGIPGKMKGELALTRLDGTGGGPTACQSAFFDGQVMGLVLKPVCANCHVAGGAAATATFRVTITDSLATQQSVARHIDLGSPANSHILLKPLGQLAHGGGQQLGPGSQGHQILSDWVNRVVANTHCDGEVDTSMEPLGPAELLVRASMDLRGKRPRLADIDAVEANPNAYAAFVDTYLDSPEFLERVKDIYDDALLVRREDQPDDTRDETWAIYAEALELVGYIVANDRPFTEIGTADYTVANQTFQQNPLRMPYPMEPVTGTAWQPTHYLDGRPHAGLLSTSAFYEVWDTNNTNKNRRRANRWSIVFHCYNFLDTPVDVTRDVDNADADAVLNAVTSRADCKACHQTLDPLASFLFPLDRADGLESDGADGFWSEERAEIWRTANRRPPAVYGAPGTDLRDLGRLLVENDRFAECQTQRAFELLFLRKPQTNDELTTAADIALRWRTEDGHNFRSLVRRWMLSDAYRNRPTDADPAWVRRVSPERLETLIADLTGFVWTRESEAMGMAPIPRLTSADDDGFKIILGGVNGVSVTKRTYSLNASVSLVHRKVASLAAAHVVATDLALPSAQRVLLTGVRGDEDPDVDEAALRTHVARIARRLYGERHAPDSSRLDAWIALYGLLYEDGTQSTEVPGTPGERAWRGLLAAMLRSPRILLY
jgi:hypothetical protein